MATTLASGEQITVLAEVGFITNFFVLDDAEAGVLDNTEFVLDGNLEGVDITEYCQEVSITRGRQDQFAQFNAGQCAIKLVNNDRRFDPINEDSPYWDTAAGRSGVVPRRKVTITSGANYLFTGRITDIDVVYDYNLSTVTITAADDFVLLANTVVEADTTPSVELSGARVNYLLDLPEIDYPLTTRDISAGLATLGAYTISANTNALTYLQQIATSEQGACFIAANGDLTFTDRLDASFATIAAEFSDAGTNIPYTALQVIYGQEFLYNRIQATIQGGTVQIADNAASQAEFGITTYSLPDLLLQSDSEALTLANYLVGLYANPQYRFDDLGLVTSAMSAPNRDAINALELQDVVTVTRTYTTGSPLSVTEYYAVERLTHLITAGEHRVTVGLFNTEIVFEFILGGYTTTTTRTNLVKNPNFETNATGWTGGGGASASVARSTAQQYIGSASLAVTSGVNGTARAFCQNVAPRIAVTAGTSYTFSAYTKSPTSARLVDFLVSWYDNSGTYLSDTESADFTNTTTGWTRITYTVTAIANSFSCTPSIRFFNTVTGEVNYIDAVLVEQASSALPYFDGTYADAYSGYTLTEQAWNGTVDASISTATWGLNSSFILGGELDSDKALS